MPDRDKIPSELKRRVLMEAGHRCAIPTCRHPTTEIAHIVPYTQVREHKLLNLIALCPNCHTRYDRGEIDRVSMRLYKRKLVFLSDRYSRYELAVLHALRSLPRVVVHGHLLVDALLGEDLIQVEREHMSMEFDDGYKVSTMMSVTLTERGRDFLLAWDDPADTSVTYEGSDGS